MYKAGDFYKFEFHKGVCVQLNRLSEGNLWAVSWHSIDKDGCIMPMKINDVVALNSGWTNITSKISKTKDSTND